MNALAELLARGGPTMLAIMLFSVVLYWRCARLLLSLWRARRELQGALRRTDWQWGRLSRTGEDLQSAFARQRVTLGAMIAAAPLLGLLGTVSGMEKTFESLSGRAGEKSMEGLAHGISEVLVATESGLAVALPALLFVYLAHRQVLKHLALLNRFERTQPARLVS